MILMKPIFLRIVILVGFVGLFSPVMSGQGMQKLKAFQSQIKTFEAVFHQKVVDDNKNQLQESSGKVYLLRPNKFRWDYKKPDEQYIVSNGKKIWIYNTEMKALSVKKLKGPVSNSLARILSGTQDLSKSFRILDKGKKNGVWWVELAPKSDKSSFKVVRLGFTRTLKMIETEDQLGHISTFEFTQIKTNPKLQNALFNFKVPN